MKTLLCTVLAITAGVSTSFSSSISERAKNSEGLLDFLLNQNFEDELPVQILPSREGRVSTARVQKDRDGGLRVSGIIRRTAISAAGRGSHVDVAVVDENERVLANATTAFFPRRIPRTVRGMPEHSHYSVNIPKVPSSKATVHVRFHTSKQESCESRGF